MMGAANPQRAFFYNISLETFVPAAHPLRCIRPLINDRAIRRACGDLYSPIGRPSNRTPPGRVLTRPAGAPWWRNGRRWSLKSSCPVRGVRVRIPPTADSSQRGPAGTESA